MRKPYTRPGAGDRARRRRADAPHRQLKDAAWSYRTTEVTVLRGGSILTRDTVEALVMLTAPTTVMLTTSTGSVSKDCLVGVTPALAPLGLGKPVVKVVRNGKVVLEDTSPHVVTDKAAGAGP